VAANTPSAPRAPILDEADAASRAILLTELQATLSALGTRSIRANRHRLVLRYNDPPPLMPSGPTDPALHIFSPAGTRVATTDGTVYQLNDGQEFPVSDPAAAATAICRTKPASRQATLAQ